MRLSGGGQELDHEQCRRCELRSGRRRTESEAGKETGVRGKKGMKEKGEGIETTRLYEIVCWEIESQVPSRAVVVRGGAWLGWAGGRERTSKTGWTVPERGTRAPHFGGDERADLLPPRQKAGPHRLNGRASVAQRTACSQWAAGLDSDSNVIVRRAPLESWTSVSWTKAALEGRYCG